MTPEHQHTITITARRWPLIPWLPTTNTWDRICRCKEADAIVNEVLTMAESRPGRRMVLTLRCDARPHPETYVSEGTRW